MLPLSIAEFNEAALVTCREMGVAGGGDNLQGGRSPVFQASEYYQLASYDAAYLELAMREGLPIATIDSGMLKAMTALGISQFKGS